MGKEKRKIIDGKQVIVLKRKLVSRINLKVKILNVVGFGFMEALKPVVDIFKVYDKGNDIDLADVNIEPFIEGIGRLFSDIDPDKITELLNDIMQGVVVDECDMTDDEELDKVFGDDMVAYYKLVGYVLYSHFSSFFLNLSNMNLLDMLREKIEKATKSSSDASGDLTKE